MRFIYSFLRSLLSSLHGLSVQSMDHTHKACDDGGGGRILRLIAMTGAVVLAFSLPARAEIFQWQDPVSKVSLTVPDTWRMVHGQKPDDVVTFYAPGADDHASCRMRVRKDRRFMIYPVRFSDEVQRTAYNAGKFWDDYLAEFDGYKIHEMWDNAGLGRGFGTYAEASFVTSAGPKMQKRGVMFASLYRDKAYILECSAEAHAYARHHDAFMNVAKAVDFRKAIHEFPAGHYRDFIRDGGLKIKAVRAVDWATY